MKEIADLVPTSSHNSPAYAIRAVEDLEKSHKWKYSGHK